MSTVIINADDFGLNSSVNKAIVESFNSALINSTTLMANMPGFEEAVEIAHNQKLIEKIGIHLVLTDGSSLTEEINSMDLFFKKNAISSSLRFKKLFFLNRREQNIIFKEFAAQIEKVKNSGIPITHLDTHHQIHDMWAIMQILIELLKRYNIPSMRILNNLEKSHYYYKNAYRSVINYYLKGQKVNFTDFLGNQTDIITVLKKNPAFLSNQNKKIEIMVHPCINANGLLTDKIGDKEYDFGFQKTILNCTGTF
jgi:chitin disaccharide deacetylase